MRPRSVVGMKEKKYGNMLVTSKTFSFLWRKSRKGFELRSRECLCRHCRCDVHTNFVDKWRNFEWRNCREASSDHNSMLGKRNLETTGCGDNGYVHARLSCVRPFFLWSETKFGRQYNLVWIKHFCQAFAIKYRRCRICAKLTLEASEEQATSPLAPLATSHNG